ncbi:MAG: YtxH domain-containing protein [Actinobacteria bacterium]|nr:YtxH domain-containing protein [Actinomycetota bacterium]
MGKMGFLVGFGAGYVLGAKAGTERYDQLRRLYDNLSASPAVRQARGKAKDAATSGLGSAKDAASGSVAKVRDAVKRDDGDHSGLTVAPPPT